MNVMKHIKSINEFHEVEKINEEWLPYDIFFVPKDISKLDSYLEFEGFCLKEITGKKRNLKLLLNNIKNICSMPESITEMFDAHIYSKKTKKSKDTHTREVKGFAIQIKNKSDEKLITKELSELGSISKIQLWGPNIKVDLYNPIQLTFNPKYAF